MLQCSRRIEDNSEPLCNSWASKLLLSKKKTKTKTKTNVIVYFNEKDAWEWCGDTPSWLKPSSRFLPHGRFWMWRWRLDTSHEDWRQQGVFICCFSCFMSYFFSCICRNNELLKHTLTSSWSSHYDRLTLLKWSLNWYLYSPLISFRGSFKAPDFTWSALLQSIRDKDGLIAIMASCNTKHVGFFLWTTLHSANCCITWSLNYKE